MVDKKQIIHNFPLLIDLNDYYEIGVLGDVSSNFYNF